MPSDLGEKRSTWPYMHTISALVPALSSFYMGAKFSDLVIIAILSAALLLVKKARLIVRTSELVSVEERFDLTQESGFGVRVWGCLSRLCRWVAARATPIALWGHP